MRAGSSFSRFWRRAPDIRPEHPTTLAGVPALFAPTQKAAKRFLEYFAANIRNSNTRRAYVRAVLTFAAWCEAQDLTEIVDIEPVHVAAFIEQLCRFQATGSIPPSNRVTSGDDSRQPCQLTRRDRMFLAG